MKKRNFYENIKYIFFKIVKNKAHDKNATYDLIEILNGTQQSLILLYKKFKKEVQISKKLEISII